MKRLSACLTAALLCTLAPTLASAQTPAVAPAPTGDTNFAISTLYLPVESAFLRTKLELGFQYTNASFGNGPFSADVNVIFLGVDAQYAFNDRFEVGLTLPFLVNANGGFGGAGGSSTELGNLTLKLKGLLFGQNRGKLAISLFANTTFATGTSLPARDFALLQAGVAVSSNPIPNLTVGGAVGVIAGLGMNGDPVLFTVDLFGGYRFHPKFAAQLAVQLGTQVNPKTNDPGLALMPAVQFFATPNLHIDLGARIAANDAGKAYTPLGRAALMFAAGYQM